MEFWGIAVKPGEIVRVDPGEDTYLHLSQSALGEMKKDKISESVSVFVKVDDKKLVIGSLSGEKFPQISHDLVFNDEFELSHSSKSTTLYFLGYKAQADGEEPGSSDTDSESDNEAIELAEKAEKANGKPDSTEGVKAAKLVSGQVEGSSKKSKAKVEDSKAVKSKQESDDDSDSDSDEEDSDEDESDSGDEDMIAAMGDSSDEGGKDDSSDEEDETTPKKVETPKKAEISKKRGADSAIKTPVPEKKAKLVSPSGSQKTGGGKKSVHTATPYPTKQAAKTPANTDKSKPKSPKSGGGSGSIACKSCSKTFNSDSALQSHTKAKHEAK